MDVNVPTTVASTDDGEDKDTDDSATEAPKTDDTVTTNEDIEIDASATDTPTTDVPATGDENTESDASGVEGRDEEVTLPQLMLLQQTFQSLIVKMKK